MTFKAEMKAIRTTQQYLVIDESTRDGLGTGATA